MTEYDVLAEVYEWLISDARLPPAEFAASFDDVLSLLPSNAHVLDCSCGTGQLAVGLAGRGIQVVATDASEAMVRRTAELSAEFGASVRAARANWEELPDHFEDGTFDMLFCVGNSLHHAAGATGRGAALESMSRLLRPGGRLVLTSRTWELVRARGSRLDISDRLVRRNGRDAVVVYRWEIASHWGRSTTSRLRSPRLMRLGWFLSARNCCPAGPTGTRNSKSTFTGSDSGRK